MDLNLQFRHGQNRPAFKKILLVMKLIILLLTTAILQVSANSFAQKISLYKNKVPLRQILNDIRSQSGYDFLYNNNLLKNAKPVSISVTDATIEQVLAVCLADQQISYKIEDRAVFLKEKSETLVKAFSANVIAVPVKGKITDDKGLPLPGVSIAEKGTKNVVSTNSSGEFVINVTSNSAILVISSVGFVTKEVDAGSVGESPIVLATSQENLTEVVVTAYGKVSKATLTDAITTIDSKKLENRPLRTIADGLIGLAPGLNIRIPSGAPEAVPSLNIRGFTGFGTSGSPLVLIDGVERPIQDVNPNDVESISLLKDGASAVIYGSRAPYGVLLITTKSGKAGTLSVNYTSNYRYASIARLPEQNHSYDWADYINQLQKSNPTGTGTAIYTDLTIARMRAWSAGDFDNPVFAGLDKKYVLNGQYPLATSSYGYSLNEAFADVNYIDEYFKKNVPSNQQNLSFSGGSENIKYYGSLGYSNVDGGLKGFDNYDKRYNVLTKVDFKATNWLSFNTSLNYVRQGFQGTNYRGAGIDYNTLFSVVGREYYNVPIRNPDNPNYYTAIVSVPTAQGAGGARTVDGNDLTFTGGFKATPVKGLDIDGSYSWRSVNNQDETIQKIIPAYFPNGTIGSSLRTSNTSSISKTYDALQYQFYKLSVGYTKTVAEKHNFYAQVGGQGEQNLFKSLSGSGQDIFSPNTVNTISTTAGNYRASDRLFDWSTLGFYGVFTYDYDQKYMVKFAARSDASSRFADGARWGFFPSVSAGWNVAKENFWPLKNTISTFKFTGSYSKSGDLASAGIANYYTSYPTLSAGTSAQTILGGAFATFVNPPGLVSNQLTWAKPAMLNLGIDIDAFKNRFNIKYEWYQRTVYDQAGPPEPVAQVLGTGAPSTNNSVSETRGWELSLSWNDNLKVGGQTIQYGATFNMADYVGYVVSYRDNGTGTRSGQWTPGEVFGANYMYEGNGTIQNTADLYNRVLTGGYNYPGYFSYKDLNGDGVINTGAGGGWYSLGDTKLNGYNYPRKTYSITPNISWKGIHLNTIFDGVMQWTVFGDTPYTFGTNGSQFFSPFYKQTTNLGFWNTNNRDAFFPAIGQGRTANDKYALNLAHLRVRSVTLGYDLPKQWISKVKLQKVNVYVSGENMGFIYSKSYVKYDPELLNVSGNGYPPMKFYSFGLNVGL